MCKVITFSANTAAVNFFYNFNLLSRTHVIKLNPPLTAAYKPRRGLINDLSTNTYILMDTHKINAEVAAAVSQDAAQISAEAAKVAVSQQAQAVEADVQSQAAQLKAKAAAAMANAREGIAQAAAAAQQAVDQQQNDPNSALNQARNQARQFAGKVKSATADAMERGAETLENLAAKLRK